MSTTPPTGDVGPTAAELARPDVDTTPREITVAECVADQYGASAWVIEHRRGINVVDEHGTVVATISPGLSREDYLRGTHGRVADAELRPGGPL